MVKGIPDLYVSSAEAAIDKPGYGVHDFYLQWQPAALERLTLSLTLKNAFDKQYLDHGSIEDFTHLPDYAGVVGSPAAGRDVRVTAALSF
jgi:hemoglobin/transferrin/lactoferrin receptor protein